MTGNQEYNGNHTAMDFETTEVELADIPRYTKLNYQYFEYSYHKQKAAMVSPESLTGSGMLTNFNKKHSFSTLV